MAAKWQQWMPFHIDRFMGSRHVQAMHPAARIGYLYLLAAQWQTDDGSLADDDEELCILSGIGDLWKQFSSAIRRMFSQTEDGKLRNLVCFEEWNRAREKFKSSQEKGKKGGRPKIKAEKASRKANKKNDLQEPNLLETSAFAQQTSYNHIDIDSNTNKNKEPKDQNLPAASATGDAPSLHKQCHEAVDAYWQSHHPGEEHAPWDGSDAKALSKLLSANPKLTIAGFQRLIDKRARSNVNPSERPRAWLERLTDFASGPLNEFKQPKEEAPTKAPQMPVFQNINRVQ